MDRKFIDMNAEQQLALFLDQYFYLKLKNDSKYKSIKRESEQFQQYKGIDVIIETDLKKYNIDEKAQLYYTNMNLPTFAFEIDFINRRNEWQLGWLLDDKLMTDYYLLIWPEAKHTKISELTVEDFTKLDCLMIKKAVIIEYLEKKSWNKGRIIEYAKYLRAGDIRERINIDQKDFYFYFSLAEKYREQPINIVIKKDILNKMAEQHYIITKDEYIKIKNKILVRNL